MNELLDELQIILDCDPRRVNDKGVEQPTLGGGETTPEPPVKHSARQWDSATRSYAS